MTEKNYINSVRNVEIGNVDEWKLLRQVFWTSIHRDVCGYRLDRTVEEIGCCLLMFSISRTLVSREVSGRRVNNLSRSHCFSDIICRLPTGLLCHQSCGVGGKLSEFPTQECDIKNDPIGHPESDEKSASDSKNLQLLAFPTPQPWLTTDGHVHKKLFRFTCRECTSLGKSKGSSDVIGSRVLVFPRACLRPKPGITPFRFKSVWLIMTNQFFLSGESSFAISARMILLIHSRENEETCRTLTTLRRSPCPFLRPRTVRRCRFGDGGRKCIMRKICAFFKYFEG